MGTFYPVQVSAVQDASNLLVWSACCPEDGWLQAGQTACTVTLYLVNGDDPETAISGATETVNLPSANNTFNGSMTVAMDAGSLYNLYAEILVDGTIRYGVLGIYVPVRTA